MDNKEFRQKLLALVLPVTFGQLMLAAVSASDALMVGVISQDLPVSYTHLTLPTT